MKHTSFGGWLGLRTVLYLSPLLYIPRQGEFLFFSGLRCNSYAISEVFGLRSETRFGQKIHRFGNRRPNRKTRLDLENNTKRDIHRELSFITKNTLVTNVFFVVDLGKQAFTKNTSVTAGLNRWILRSRPNYISFLDQGLRNNSSFSLVFYRILHIRRNFSPKLRKFVF